jgi:tetratricopeptide (TPR) repeat protein
LAEALDILADAVQTRGELLRARDLYAEGLELARDMHDDFFVNWLLEHLAVIDVLRGDLDTARTRFEEVRAGLREAGGALSTVHLLGMMSHLASELGEIEGARRHFSDALSYARALNDPWESAEALHALAWIAGREGNYDEARALFNESYDLTEGHMQPFDGWWANSWKLNHLGDLSRAEGDFESATELYEASLALFREQGNLSGTAAVLHNLGHVALARDDRERARALFVESMALFQQLGHMWSTADCVAGLAGVAAREGQLRRAVRLFAAADATHRALDASGLQIEPPNRAAWERDTELARSQLDADAWNREWAEGQAMSLADAVVLALEE